MNLSSILSSGKVVFTLTIFHLCLLTAQQAYSVSVNGPTVGCPGQGYDFTITNISNLATETWVYIISQPDNGATIFRQVNYGNQHSTITINHLFPLNYTGYVEVRAVSYIGGTRDWNPGIIDNNVLGITLRVPSPAAPNNGLVIGCSVGDNVSISSLPALQNNANDCYFFCQTNWVAPSGFSFNNQGNSISGQALFDNLTLTFPGGLSNGSQGTTTITASAFGYYSFSCNVPLSSSASSTLWYGPPIISNAQVNGSSYSGSTIYVPSGYATLNIQVNGTTSGTNWYIANGSGSLSPSFNYCTVNFSNFVRVVVETNNRCGNGGSYTFYLSTQQGYYGYRIAPNPAKDKVSILLDYKELVGDLIKDITLYDEKMTPMYFANTQKMKTFISNTNSIDIPTRDLPRGKYFLHVNMGNEIQKNQIILN